MEEDKMEAEEMNHEYSESLTDEFYEYRIIEVDGKQSPLRIDKFVMDRVGEVSRNRVQNAIKTGSVLVDMQEVKPNFRIKPGQKITLILPKSTTDKFRLVPQNIPLNVMYEDEDLLVINKPPGLVVHPGVGHFKGTLVNALAYHLKLDPKQISTGNFQERVGLVHRIDKNTSGLLVVAKNEFALSHLAKQFFYHTIERTYYAIVWGEPQEDRGTINANVGRHPRFRKDFTVFPEGDQGKWAVTHYEVLERLYYVSVVKCTLETGRTHQIRVHLKYLGHTLFNDEKYGGDEILKGTIFSKYKTFVDHMFDLLPRHALHAKSLGFIHPRTNKFMHFESELPDDFNASLEQWRIYLQGRKASMKGNFS